MSQSANLAAWLPCAHPAATPLLMTIPSLKPLQPAVKKRTPAYASRAKLNKHQGGMPVSIQLEQPKTMKWNHKNFLQQITPCRPPDCRCAASIHRPPIGAEPPATASCLSLHHPRNPPSHHTTPSRRLFSYDSRCGRALSATKWAARLLPLWQARHTNVMYTCHGHATCSSHR